MLKDFGIKGCVFDFDGTIVLTEHIHIKAWEYLAKQVNLAFPPGFMDQVVGFSDRELIERLALAWNEVYSPTEIFNLKQGFYLSEAHRFEALELVPGVIQAIKQLSHQVPIALATNSAWHEVEPILDHVGIKSYFKSIHTIDTVQKPKPDPEIYLNACRSLGEDPENCLAFEDSLAGATAVRGARLRLIAMTTYFPAEYIGPAWRSVPNFFADELVDLLG